MKIIAIGDIHGRKDWKQIVENIDYDKVIFIGDYFDTFEPISAKEQILNFENLIDFKLANKSSVVLLTGNHDYHYLKNVNEKYSGFQELFKIDIQESLHKALDADLLQMCFIHQNYIFSHAGITKTWLKNVDYDAQIALELFINDLFKYKPLSFKFTSGKNRSSYGDDICQSPIWVRPQSLYDDGLPNVVQIVGHTSQKKINFIENKIVIIDTLDLSGQFLCIDDKKMAVLDIQSLKA